MVKMRLCRGQQEPCILNYIITCHCVCCEGCVLLSAVRRLRAVCLIQFICYKFVPVSQTLILNRLDACILIHQTAVHIGRLG